MAGLWDVFTICNTIGLGSCTQAALAEYPDIVRKELNIKEDQMLLFGMPLGYEDTCAMINSYRTERIALEEFTQFYS